MDDIGAGLSSIAVFAFLAFIIWHGSREKLEKRRLRIEEQSRILDRIGNGAELAEFLKTEEGRRFLEGIGELEKDQPRINAYKIGVIGLVTAGIFCLILGLSFFVLAASYSDRFVIPGVIVTGVGLACLIASWMQYVVGKRWGMFGPDRDDARPRRTLE